MKSAISPRWADPGGMRKQSPAASSVQHMLGKVNSSKARRPYVSMVHTAGHANRKLTMPKPHEANRAPVTLAPASAKMVDE